MAQISLHDVPGTHALQFRVRRENMLAGNTNHPVVVMPFKAKVTKFAVVFNAGVTGDDADFITLELIEKAGDGSLALLAFTAGVDATAFVEKEIVLQSAAATALAAGTVLNLLKREAAAGPGMAMPELEGYVEFEGI